MGGSSPKGGLNINPKADEKSPNITKLGRSRCLRKANAAKIASVANLVAYTAAQLSGDGDGDGTSSTVTDDTSGASVNEESGCMCQK